MSWIEVELVGWAGEFGSWMELRIMGFGGVRDVWTVWR